MKKLFLSSSFKDVADQLKSFVDEDIKGKKLLLSLQHQSMKK